MALRVAKSSLARELLKFRYLQGNNKGGQAMRMCISRMPPSCKAFTLSFNCVPRTMESSINTPLLPLLTALLGINFIRATNSRASRFWGIKLQGQVGVYFEQGRFRGRPGSCL